MRPPFVTGQELSGTQCRSTMGGFRGGREHSFRVPVRVSPLRLNLLMPDNRIARTDLEPVLAAHHGNQDLERAFAEAKAPERLLSVLGRYIQFNSAFGAGLANLAGEIAARQGLFRDAQEPLRIVADRSAEVASDFFFAAIDEFDDRATPWRDTYRTLGQA